MADVAALRDSRVLCAVRHLSPAGLTSQVQTVRGTHERRSVSRRTLPASLNKAKASLIINVSGVHKGVSPDPTRAKNN